MSRIDQELATLEPSQARFAQSLMSQLKTAMSRDVVENLSGEGAENLGRQLRELDHDFSRTMQTLFETSTAKRITAVRRRGLRAASDEATRTPVDQLAKLVVNIDSPRPSRS